MSSIRFRALTSVVSAAVVLPLAVGQTPSRSGTGDVFNSTSIDNNCREVYKQTSEKINDEDLRKQAQFSRDQAYCKNQACIKQIQIGRAAAHADAKKKVDAAKLILRNCEMKPRMNPSATGPSATGGDAAQGPGGRGTGIPAEEILTPGDRKLFFDLGAEMNVIAQEQEQKHDPGTEFIGGVAEWARDQIELLAQKPGVPVTQMAQGIIEYFVNDNAANHKALRQAAGEAVKEFRKNPARFLGKNLPNLLPGPGQEVSAAKAIQQIERVEQAAGKINGLARAEKEFGKAYEGVLDDASALGAAAPDKCFATNACFPTALAHADLIKTGGPLGDGTPFRIIGVKPSSGTIRQDLRHSSQQIEDRLKPYGKNYQPRNPNSFTPDELKKISEGIMVEVDGPGRIKDILDKEGIGSHGLTFVRFQPALSDKNPLGHVFNAQNDNRVVKFIDHTQPGVDPPFTSSRVSQWFYFPIQ